MQQEEDVYNAVLRYANQFEKEKRDKALTTVTKCERSSHTFCIDFCEDKGIFLENSFVFTKIDAKCVSFSIIPYHFPRFFLPFAFPSLILIF